MIRRALLLPCCLLLGCGAHQASSLKEELSSYRAAARAGATSARAQRDLGAAALLEGEIAEAEAALARAHAADPADLRTLLLLGLRAHDTDQVHEARSYLTQILERYRRGEPWAGALAELAAHRLLMIGTDAPLDRGGEREFAERIYRVWRAWRTWQRRAAGSGAFPDEAFQLLSAYTAQLLRLMGREREALSVDQARGCPDYFYTTGPHGHLPRLDLGTPFPPDDPRRDPGRAAYQRRHAHGCELVIDSHGAPPGVMYAIAYAHVPASGSYPLTIEAGREPWSLYIDGARAYTEEEPRRRRHLLVKLARGWHALSLKLAAPADRVRVQIALTGARFHDGLSGQAPEAARPMRGRASRRALSELPAASGPTWEVLRALLIAQQRYIEGDTDGGIEAVEEGMKTAPRFASLIMLLAGILGDESGRPSQIIKDRVRRAFRRALDADPGMARARLNLAYMELEEDQPDRALALLSEAPQRPDMERIAHTHQLRHRVHMSRGFLIEAEAALDKARALAPASCQLIDAAIELRRALKDQRGVLALSRELARCNPYSDRHADELRGAGLLTDAQAEYERLLRLEPENESWTDALLDVMLARPREERAPLLGRARAIMARQLARAPRAVHRRVKLANLLLELGQRQEAEQLLDAGLRLTPESQELGRALLALGRKGPMEPYRVDGREVIARFEQQRKAERSDAAILVLDRAVTRVFENGARMTLTHNIIWVLSKEGVDRFGEVDVPEGAEVLTLRTVKADGTTREPEEIPDKESVSVPDLEVGDYVEFEHITRTAPLPAFPKGFLAERFYFVSPETPLDRTEYVLVAPCEMPLQIDTRGDAPAARSERRGADRVMTWAREKVPRLRPEPPQADGLQVEWLPSVRAASGISLAGWRDFLRDRYAQSLRANLELVRLAREQAGAGGPLDKLRRLDHYVRRNIKESGSLEELATVILARKEGSRKVLLQALLKAVGIESELWLVRPVTAPRLAGPLPDIETFSEAVLAVRAGGALRFVDPHHRHIPTGLLRPPLRGGAALPIRAGTSDGDPLTRIPVPSIAEVPSREAGAAIDSRKVSMDMRLQADGSGEVTVREELRGWPAVEWREEAERLSEDKMRQSVEQRSLGYFFPGASLTGLSFSPRDEDAAPLIVEYRFTAPQLARMHPVKEGGRAVLVLPAPYPALLGRRYVATPQRSTTLVLNYVVPTDLTARVELPAQAGEVRTAPPMTLSLFGRFAQRADQEGQRLLVRTHFSMPLLRVEPRRYEEFVRYSSQVDAAEDRVALIPILR